MGSGNIIEEPPPPAPPYVPAEFGAGAPALRPGILDGPSACCQGLVGALPQGLVGICAQGLTRALPPYWNSSSSNSSSNISSPFGPNFGSWGLPSAYCGRRIRPEVGVNFS